MNKKYSDEIGFRELYEKFESSKLSLSNFCIENDISKTYFYKLKRKYITNPTSEVISIKPVKIVTDITSSSEININGFIINIDDISDHSLIRLLRIIKNL